MTVQCVSSGFLSFSQNVFNVTPDILFDGLRAFKQGSPNMNSLVGFGSAAAFAISSVSAFAVPKSSVSHTRILMQLFFYAGVLAEP
jgi:cation transport ATPase